ncbi:citrate transporter [Citreicella sp. SE45]|nr:citrate transporter [Citreicella sp. SE45]
MGLFGIVLSLGLLMYLAYRGINVLILAPLLAMLAVLLSGGLPVLATYTQVFMKSLGGYVITYFPLFLLGAIFGKVMADGGAARTIAERIVDWVGAGRAILAVVLACGVLTYAGCRSSWWPSRSTRSPTRCSPRRRAQALLLRHRAGLVHFHHDRFPARRRSRTPSPSRSSAPTSLPRRCSARWRG